MAKLSTIALSDTFGTWLTGANESYARINQFAVNESSLYANTISANVALQTNTIRQRVAGPLSINANTNVVGTFANVVSTNTNILGGSLLVSSNVNFTGAGHQVQGGVIDLYTNTGSPAYIKFFCETNNAHGIKLKAATHAEQIGASNRDLVIPAANGYLLWGSASDDSRQTLTSNVHFTGANVHFDGANVMYKGQLLDTRYANTTNLALKQTIAVERAALANTNTYIATKASQADHLAALANTNAYIASMSTDVQLANTNLAIAQLNTNLLATNTAIRLLNTNTQTALDTQEAKQATNLGNTNSYIAATAATERASLANTNSYIAATAATERASLANTNTFIATKLNSSSYTEADVRSKAALANTNAYIAATAVTAGAALPKAGGAMTGAITGITHANSVIFTNATATGGQTLNFTTSTHFHLTLTGNITLNNPTTEVPGTSGLIFLKQDGSGSRTLSLGTDFETPASAGHTLSTAGGATDIIPYYVVGAGRILLGQIQRAFG